MGETKEDILLQISLDDEDTRVKLESTTKAINGYKDAQKSLNDQIQKLTKDGFKANSIEILNLKKNYDSAAIQIKALTKEQLAYTNQLVQSAKASNAEEGSINQRRALLSALTAQYNDAAKPTKELASQIKKLSDELKDQESELGNDTRKVGSYKQAIREALLEVENLTKGTKASNDEINSAKQKAADLKDEYERFKKSVGALDVEHNLSSIAGTAGNIGSSITTATQSLHLFGSASDTVASGVSGIATGINVIGTAPAILKEAKIAMEGFAVATGLSTGGLTLIAGAIAAIGVAAYTYLSQTTETVAEKMQRQKELVKDRYEFEIGYLKALGKDTSALEQKSAQDQIDFNNKTIEEIKNNALRSGGQLSAYKRSLGIEDQKLTKENLDKISELSEQNKLLNRQILNQKAEDYKKHLDDIYHNALDNSRKEIKLNEEANAKILQDQLDNESELAKGRNDMLLFNRQIKNDIKEDSKTKYIPGLANLDEIDQRGKDILDRRAAINQLIFDASAQDAQAEQAFRLEQLNIQERQELASAEKTGEDVLLIQKKYDNLRQAAVVTKFQKDISQTNEYIGIAASLFKKGGGEFKTLSSVQALINTYSGVTAATAPPPVGLGPVAGIPLAIKTLFAGLANVAAINGFQFYDGGYTGDGNPKWVSTAAGPKPYTYHFQEYIAPHQVVQNPAAAPHISALEAMRTGSYSPLSYLPGFASGGFAVDYSSIASQNGQGVRNSEILADVFRQINFQPVVTVEEINIGQSNVRVRESRAVS